MTRHLVSIGDLSNTGIASLLTSAASSPRPSGTELLGKTVALMFFEPSTRTYMSFSAAAQKLGAAVIGFQDAGATSAAKGETLEDAIRVCNGYADVIVLRHPEPGSAARAVAVSDVPVVNAGDGANEHPTQTLLDLFTITARHGRFEGLDFCFAGDLLNGRTVHSLARVLGPVARSLRFVAPPELSLPEADVVALRDVCGSVTESTTLDADSMDVDVLYMTRLQKERSSSGWSTAPLRLTPSLMQAARLGTTVLHPLPRNEEIDVAVDADPRAAYFEQAAAGVPVRSAVLRYVLGPA